MSGCQEALLLTRQPTPAVPLQEACASPAREDRLAKSTAAFRSLLHLESIPEEQLQSSNDQKCFSLSQSQSLTEEQTPVLLTEKFPDQIPYVPPALRQQSPQGSCNLPTVFSGQLLTQPT
ncbi:hypothetical protein ABBQ32_009933 [Trebouxia sp. C0010 RCD-2024]